MLGVRVKQPEEIILERKLRNPIRKEDEEVGPKYTFFRNKMKEFINYHLDYAKYNKKIISEEDFEEIQKFDDEEEKPKRVFHRKSRSVCVEMEAEPKQLRDLLIEKISSFEKIMALVSSSFRVLTSLNSEEFPEIVHTKASNLSQVLATIQSLSSKEINSFHHLLTILETFTQKQAAESASVKKTLQERYLKDLDSVREKYENKIKALTQHNKALVSNKRENKIQQTLKERIESLECLLSESDKQILEKIDQIKQKNFEISSLNQQVSKQAEEVVRAKKDLSQLEEIMSLDQQRFRQQVQELTSEIATLRNISQENLMAHELKVAELQYLADSSKYRLDQVVEALAKADEQVEYVKLAAGERERALESENLELRNEVDRLDRIVFGLREELVESKEGFESQHLQFSKNKDDEILQLNKLIDKLEIENGQILKSNKELSVMNHKLESELFKSKETKSLKSSKSDKKLKKK